MKNPRYQHLWGPYNRGLRAEFLPRWIQYGMTYIYICFLAIRAKSPLFFTATNPGFPLGGLYPTSKKHTLDQLPPYCVPRDTLLQAPITETQALSIIQQNNISFPLVIKPNEGINGKEVIICHTKNDRQTHIQQDEYFDHTSDGNRIVQEYADHDHEYGIFYVRLPHEPTGRITGIVQREFHSITGDGRHTMEELVHQHPRARYRYPSFAITHHAYRKTIIPQDKTIPLTDVGNHVRGVTFRDISNLITPELTSEIDTISQSVEGFFYGRYDIKADSLQAIINQKYAVLELNATYSEPTRMYDPQYHRGTVTRILCRHRNYIYHIATANHKNGTPYSSIQKRRKHKR